MNNNYLIEKYKNSLNELERNALTIAEKNLESSFCIEKSIGFLEFVKELEKEKEESDMCKADEIAIGVEMKELGFTGRKKYEKN
tara:strand:- start:3436 stop:3687 length:252 start_codon:yes stop_codon:yes gene_type:complete